MYLSDQAILKLFPYDRSDSVETYECSCGKILEVSRSLESAYRGNIRCHHCGAPLRDWTLIKQNYEFRKEAWEKSQRIRDESWKPWKPQELLDFIHKHRRDKND